jgi:argininosuccinate lyase
MLEGARFDTDRLRAAAGLGHTTATDLADWLVRVAGLPFRTAHGVAAAAVRRAEEKGCGLEDLADADLRALDPRLGPAVREVLGVDRSVASRTSLGGTAPVRVREAVAAARARFLGGTAR